MSYGPPSIEQVPVVGIYYDMGETNALKGVFKKLEKDNIDFRVIVMGTAAEKAESLGYPKEKILYLNRDFKDITTIIDAKNTNREKELSKKEVVSVAKKIAQLKPEAIVLGVVSKAQWQLAEAIAAKAGIAPGKKFAYYDNPNLLIKDNPCKVTLERFAKGDYHILVPSLSIAKSLTEPKKVVEHPGLDEFVTKVANVDRDQVQKKMEIPKDVSVITYIGGYGNGYEKSFRKFAASIKNVQKTQPLYVIVQIHPKYHNVKEKELI